MPASVPRPVLRLLALTAAAALGLSGCSSDSGKARAGGSGSTTSSSSAASPSPTSTVQVPAGQRVTAQGSRLSFGRVATVVYEPAVGRGTVLRLRVASVRRGRLADFKGFILDDAYKRKASYYYARVTVRNVGKGNVGGTAVPVYGVNGSDTLLPPVSFTTTFRRCPSRRLPASFGPGSSLSTCLVYLSPNRGKLVALSFRPTQDFNPITWTGTIAAAKAVTKKPTRGKR